MSGAPTQEQVRDADDVRNALLEAGVVLPVGSGSKPAMLTASATTLRLDMRSLSGITEYAPAEYTITALAGTPIEELEDALRRNGQFLPFDPVLVKSGATVGGTVASGLSGSGRLRYGGLRDFILGTRFVDGQGRLIRGGGKVVKNAAGFDFPKLLVGSMGRLGVMIDATFKVFPKPPAFATLFSEFETVDNALTVVTALSVSPVDLFALDIEVALSGNGCTLATRIGGAEDLLEDRARRIQKYTPAATILEGEADADYWSRAREFSWAAGARHLVKVPMTPERIPALEQELSGGESLRRYAVAGNVLWATWSSSLESLHEKLVRLGLAGVVLRGQSERPLIGTRPDSIFAKRVKAALDPSAKFLPIF